MTKLKFGDTVKYIGENTPLKGRLFRVIGIYKPSNEPKPDGYLIQIIPLQKWLEFDNIENLELEYNGEMHEVSDKDLIIY